MKTKFILTLSVTLIKSFLDCNLSSWPQLNQNIYQHELHENYWQTFRFLPPSRGVGDDKNLGKGGGVLEGMGKNVEIPFSIVKCIFQ